MNFWDTNYSVAGYKYGTRPNAFLAEQATKFLPHSRILLPGDGEGRNSVWLAKLGHNVMSIDYSKVGLEKAANLARRENASINTCLSDLSEWTPDSDIADVVVLTYLHLEPDLRVAVHQKVANALKKDGLVVLEAFHPKQHQYTSGGPKSVDMLYTLETIRSDFENLLIEKFGSECETTLDEGLGHKGKAFVTRWIGKKPKGLTNP